MTTDADRRVDIVDLLLDDHQVVERLLGRLDVEAVPDRRSGLFRELTTALVQHEVAEEVTVYPFIRRLGGTGEVEADARIREQAEAESLLGTMQQLDVMGAEFAARFDELRRAVLRHARLEESVVFPYLTSATTPDDRSAMGRRYERAVQSAPTRPHPNAPDTPPGNRIVGPVAALADRVRDAFQDPAGDA